MSFDAKRFQFWCSPIYQFSFAACAFGIISKNHWQIEHHRNFPLIFSQEFHWFSSYFWAFDLIFIYGVRQESNFTLLLVGINVFPRTICWEDCSFPHRMVLAYWSKTGRHRLCVPGLICVLAALLLSHLSRARLLATPWTAAHQAPPLMGFSRREHWSGVPLPSPYFCFSCYSIGLHVCLYGSTTVSWVL